jgi:ATP synthase protein I
MAAFILSGYFIGSYLDKRLGTDPWFLLFFLLLGIVGGFWEYLKILKGINSVDNDNDE